MNDREHRPQEEQSDIRDRQEPIGEAFGNSRERQPDGEFDAFRTADDEDDEE